MIAKMISDFRDSNLFMVVFILRNDLFLHTYSELREVWHQAKKLLINSVFLPS